MIYITLAYEFFKIGLFAIGGGLVTIPFLFSLAETYPWFTTQELSDMIAVSQSTPGPIGINMATYAGYNAAGISGGIIATLSLVFPSMVIIYFIASAMKKFAENPWVEKILHAIRPAVIALILFSGVSIAEEPLHHYENILLLIALTAAMHFYKKSILLYLFISALAGMILQI